MSTPLQRLATMPANINGYSDSAVNLKLLMHVTGRAFLAELARDLNLTPGSFEIRSNKAGPSVSGEVTLHADNLYVQLLESAISERGLSLLYRSCASRRDYCGGVNHWASIRKVAEDYPRFVDECRKLAAPLL